MRTAVRATRLAALLLALQAATACDGASRSPVRAIFDLLRGDKELFAIPFPNDLRRSDDKTIQLPGLSGDNLIGLYLDAARQDRFGGFGLNSASYFTFSGPIDPRCLPLSPWAAAAADSTVALVNIDPESPGYGRRLPADVIFTPATPDKTPSRYIPANNLAVVPVPGFVLDPNTRYAVILTEGLCDPDGDHVQPDRDFERVIHPSEPSEPAERYLAAAHAAYRPLREYIRRQGLTGVVSAALFATGDPTGLAARAREVVYRSPPPEARDLAIHRETELFVELQGTYEALNFQHGDPPFAAPEDGGLFQLAANGDPVPARSESLRFSVSIPTTGPMPQRGWPVVIYAHGTGGDFRTYIEKGTAAKLAEVRDDSGEVISRLAVVGTDLNLHGARAPEGSVPELNFINVLNPAAGVDSVVQGGIDGFSLVRLIKRLSLDRARYHEDSGKRGMIRFEPPLAFDPERIYFMGHSQGTITGPVFLAHEPEIKGAVLSGAGGLAVFGMLQKTRPVNFQALFQLALQEAVDRFHPVINLVQQGLEPSDTINYGRLLLQEGREVGPKHVLLSQGFVDHYTPNDSADALATAMRIPIAGEVIRDIVPLRRLGLPPQPLPLAGNLQVGEVALTGAVVQNRATLNVGRPCSTTSQCPAHYECQRGVCTRSCTVSADCERGDYCEEGRCYDDGHQVVFKNDRASRQVRRFLATLARDGVPTLVP